MNIDLDERDLKTGVLGLALALVEVIVETLRLQALRGKEAHRRQPEAGGRGVRNAAGRHCKHAAHHLVFASY